MENTENATFARLLNAAMKELGWGGERLSKATQSVIPGFGNPVPKPTIEGWRGDKLPRNWSDVLLVAAALNRNADQTDAFLNAAGKPTLEQLLQTTHVDDKNYNLLKRWADDVRRRQQAPVEAHTVPNTSTKTTSARRVEVLLAYVKQIKKRRNLSVGGLIVLCVLLVGGGIWLNVLPSQLKLNRVRSNIISFVSSENPKALNPALKWYAGSSAVSKYILSSDPGALTLVAGPRTDLWAQIDSAPLILYSCQGDFVARVTVKANPSTPVQFAGIGVRSADSPNTWLRIARQAGWNKAQLISTIANRQGTGVVLNDVFYLDEIAYLKIERRENNFTLSYSSNGNDWLPIKTDYLLEMSENIEVFLVAISAQNNKEFSETFYDFAVIRQ